jgi:uncharacterized membrane protein YjgN (DUF898 family)
MSIGEFTLEFRGEYLEGLDQQTVLRRLRNVFGLGEDGLDGLLARPVTVLRERLPADEAERYRAALHSLGIRLHVVPGPAPAGAAAVEDETAAETVAAPRAATRVRTTMAQTMPFEFGGQGGEFFRIWIVNILLTILTLGIYSAWAKVRTNRYFYGNTRLDDSPFQYLADPVTILKGRLIAAAALLLWVFAEFISPWLPIVLVAIFVPLLPWVVVRAMAFATRNSAYRNVRFGFSGTYGGAFKTFILWPVLGVLTLGTLMPYSLYRQQRYLVENVSYGTESMAFSARVRDYYWMSLKAIGLLVGGIVAAAALGGLLAPLLTGVGMIVVYLLVFAFWQVYTVNLRFNNTTLSRVRFDACYRTGSYAWLVVTNLLGMALTLGLFYPWARVRTARYAAEHIAAVSEMSLGDFVAGEQGRVGSTGQEIGDLFNVELGI